MNRQASIWGLRMMTGGRVAAAAAIVISIGTSPGVWAQTTGSRTGRAFEVASIKPNKSGAERNSMANGVAGINYANVPLKACIRAAYDLQEYQVVGPGWLNSERYDIIANAAGPVTHDQICQMLQTLLTDRFQMKSHAASKEMAVYELTVAKNGPKHLDRPEGDAAPRRRLTGGSLVFQNAPISMFTEYLQRLTVISRPVLDATGLKGNFNFTIRLIEGDPEKGEQGEAAMKQALEQSIFTMVKGQLGLQLVPRKHMINLLVVDEIQRVPTEN